MVRLCLHLPSCFLTVLAVRACTGLSPNAYRNKPAAGASARPAGAESENKDKDEDQEDEAAPLSAFVRGLERHFCARKRHLTLVSANLSASAPIHARCRASAMCLFHLVHADTR